MRALHSKSWKALSWQKRLPGAFFALVLQAALFALLAASFTPQHRPDTPAEAVLFLPRILQRPPPVIDARQPPRTAPTPSTAPVPPPTALSAAPPPPGPQTSSAPALLAALGRALACQPDAEGRASPLISCRAARMPARDDLMALTPALPVAREAALAAERARANTPGRVPCVSMQSRIIGFGQEDHEVMVDPLCVIGELMR